MKANKRVLAILSAGHFVVDLNQGALPALLPFFKETLHLSYTMAGTIMLFANLTSSIIQPAFGHLSDRRSLEWFLPLSPLIACLGISLTGIIPNYFLLIICVIISGIGIACFHPEGFKTAYFFTGEKKATGMSLFAVGGNLGIAIGPIWGLLLITSFNMKGTLGMILPGVLVFVFLFLNMSMVRTSEGHEHKRPEGGIKRPLTKIQKKSFLLLICVGTIRALTQIGMATYIPFYYINYLKGNPLYAGKLVSTFLISGAFGTLIGAPLADRWGHKKYLLFSLISSFPFFIIFYHSKGLMTFLFLAILGMVLISSFPLTTLMAQNLLPQHLGLASGMMIGFTISAGGVGVTLLGVIADTWGVPMALKIIFILPLIAFFIALFIKYPLQKTV